MARDPEGLRTVLGRGDRLVGTFVNGTDVLQAEMLGSLFDLLVVDLEHTAMSTGDAVRAAVVAQGAGAYVLARVPSGDSPAIAHVLDAGLDGIVVPKIVSPADAAAAAARVAYPPDGTRGYAPRRANFYGRDTGYRQQARDRIVCMIQIETAPALAAVDEIAALPGVDALLLGPSDLSFELGRPLETFSDEVRGGISRTLAAAAAAGTAFALATNFPVQRLPELVDARCQILLHATDLRLIYGAFEAGAAEARAAFQAPTR